MWLDWNKDISQSSAAELPAGLGPEDKLLYLNGTFFISEGLEMHEYYAESLAMLEKTAPEVRAMQFVKVSIQTARSQWATSY